MTMKRLLAAATLGMLSMPAGAQMAAIVTAPAGAVGGIVTDGVAAFKGIPYAAPPVGPLRWHAPVAAAHWPGNRPADRYGADCAQAPFPPDAAPIRTMPSEDCLYLNVWKPASATPGAKLPVMVWIHGGGFVNGGSSPAIYAGDRFARDGIVFVSFNYRLGRFGFFAHPALAAEGGGGNFGFMDQIAALKWVRRNIGAFGGDPANVTLFGESAGGMSVNVMMTAPGARGLFARAIIESGAGRDGALPMRPLAAAARAGDAFMHAASASELRGLPTERIVAGLNMATMMSPAFSGPMIDGKTVFCTPFASYLKGDYARVPLVIGANTADGIPFVTDKGAIFASYGAQSDEARRMYDPTGTASGIDVGIATWADRNMVEPARAIARLVGRTQPVYLYRFGYVTPALRASVGGAPHASEIPYVFDTVQDRQTPPFDPGDASVARVMHGYWVAFAKHAAPAAAGLPIWPRFAARSDRIQMIEESGSDQQQDPATNRLDLNERISKHLATLSSGSQ